MARISEKSPLFRTKDEICSDVATVLNLDLKHGTKQSVIDHVLWVWTEFDGKIEGCKKWSVQAKEHGRNVLLIHEHVVPRKVLREKLFTLNNPTKEQIHSVLSSFCIGVVITKEEDMKLNKIGLRSKMPEDWDENDAWARYKKAEIDIA